MADTIIPNSYTDLTNFTPDRTYGINRALTKADSTTFARLNIPAGQTGSVYFSFDTSAIPSDAVIQTISARFKARINGTARVPSQAVQLYSGALPKGAASNFPSTTATIYDMTSVGSWTGSELQNIKLRVQATADTGGSVHRIDFFGADVTVTWISSGYAKVIQATQLAVQIANDPSHGYNQHNRYASPDFDCSSLVSYCLQQAGFNIGMHGTTTRTIGDKLSALGFTNVVDQINVNTGQGLQYGDILLTVRKHHVEFSLGYDNNNQIVEAAHDEFGGKGSDKTQPGDQTGDEIRIRRFYKWDWQYCYRWVDGSGPYVPTIVGTFVIKFKELRRGSRYAVIGPVQTLLQNYYNISVGRSGVDGIYGTDTEKAVKQFQKDKGLTADGIVGENTMKEILKVEDDT